MERQLRSGLAAKVGRLAAAPALLRLFLLARRVTQLLVGGGGALLALLAWKQRSLLYVPTPPGATRSPRDNPELYRSPRAWAIPFEDVSITTQDGVRLHAWLCHQEAAKEPAAEARYTVIFFHGNAGNIGHRLDNIRDMYEKLGVNVLIVDYRGYGDSEDGGGPTEERLVLDAVATYEWLLRRIRSPPAGAPLLPASADRLLLFGRSLGGAVALRLAERLLELRPEGAGGDRPLPLPAGLVLENTFTSLQDMVVEVFPFLSPFGPALPRVLLDPWRSLDRLELLAERRPELAWCLISGLRDEIVPPAQMQRLHNALAVRKPRVLELVEVPEGSHNDTPLAHGGGEYWERFRKFICLVEASRHATSHAASEEGVVAVAAVPPGGCRVVVDTAGIARSQL